MSKNFVELIAAVNTQISQLVAKRDALEQEQAVEARLSSIEKGNKLSIKVGRGENAKVVTAEVLAVTNFEDKGVRIKVIYGEGFDVETAVIQTTQIVGFVDEQTTGEATPE